MGLTLLSSVVTWSIKYISVLLSALSDVHINFLSSSCLAALSANTNAGISLISAIASFNCKQLFSPFHFPYLPAPT